jgi:DNA-binding MarR family transcriptional regulator
VSEPATLDAIFKLAHTVKRHFHLMLDAEQLGIVPMQLRVLKVIHKTRHCTANDIVQRIKRDKAQVTRLIAGLIDQGLIRKLPNPEDKRSQLLVFTEQGEKIQQQLILQSQKTYTQITQGLSDDEIAQFELIAEKMTRNLQ